MELASVGDRVGARVIDTLLMWPVAVGVWVAIRWTSPSFEFAGSVTPYLMLAAVGLLYEVPMVAMNGGRTLGKAATGIKVVREADGGVPRWRNSVVRWIIPAAVGVIPFIGPLLWLLVYISLTFDDARQGWHDDSAGTLVVKRWQTTPASSLAQADLSETVTGPAAVGCDSGPQGASDNHGLESTSRRPRAAPPPGDTDDDETSHNSGNAAAVSGFVLSVIAVIPPALAAYRLATVPAWKFAGFGMGVALILLLLLPYEAIFGLGATTLSIMGIVRAKTEKRPRMALGIAGLAISLITLLLTISTFVIWSMRSS
ncbi:RDD family protein [Candidatus Poriferisodalis sp.]|uniref:RDD family protein n=1 Tax=Candidatus Poriferisodalis sp. TaxID=3101277 RepID=UPI003B52650D